MPAAITAAAFAMLPRDGVKFAGAVLGLLLTPVVLVVAVAAVWIGSLVAGFGSATGATAPPPPPLPAEQMAVMRDASAATGVPWELLAGIASVESGFGANMATSWAGAIGYGQFLPASWAAFGAGGDPYDYHDAIPAMARYLAAAGASSDVPAAVYAYNHSWEYVALVLGRAAYYAAQPAPAIGATP